MKKFSKFLALVLCILMVLPCIPATAETEKVKIVYMDWDSSISQRETEWKLFFERFPEYADKVEVEIVSGGSGETNVLETIRKLVASGQKDEMPDIFTCNWAAVPEYDAMGITADLTSLYEEIGDQILPGVVELMQYNGRFLGFPVEMKTKMWVYRKDMFEAAGINPADVKNQEDLIAAGKKLQEIYPNTYIENYTMVPQAYDLYMYMTGNGARLSDENGEYIVSTDPGVREAFEWLSSMMESGVVSTTIQDFTSDWYAALNDGTLCSQLLAGWFAANHITANCPDMKGQWGCALWPEEMKYGSENGAKLQMVYNESPNKDLCIELLTKFCYSTEFAETLFKSERATVPYLKACAEDPAYLVAGTYYDADRMITEFESMKVLKVYPYTINGTAEQLIITQYLGEYLSGSMDLDTALKTAEEEMKLQIGNSLY